MIIISILKCEILSILDRTLLAISSELFSNYAKIGSVYFIIYNIQEFIKLFIFYLTK